MNSRGLEKLFRPLLFNAVAVADVSETGAPDALRNDLEVPQKSEVPSHVRLKFPPPPKLASIAIPLRGQIEWLEAEDLLDELCEDQLTLSMNLACLERASLQRPEDPCAQAALRSIEARLYDLRNIRDALALVQMATWASSVHRALLPDAPLADYLRGVYAWMHAVVRALDDLVASLGRAEPAWSVYRWRIEEAKNFHFDELELSVRSDLEALGDESGDQLAVARLATAFNTLLKEARSLEARLDQGLG